MRRFGRVVEPAWGPGLHWGLPLGLDRFDRVRTDEVRRLSVGPADALEAGSEAHGGEFLTGDLNLVRIRAIVQYRVDDPVAYVVQGEDGRGAAPAGLPRPSLSASLARRRSTRCSASGRQAIATRGRGSLRQASERPPHWACRSWA